MTHQLEPTHYPTQTGSYVALLQFLMIAVVAAFFVAASFVSVKRAIINIGSVELTPTSSTILHPTGGRLEAMFIKDGQRIKKGQPLFKIDISQQEAQLVALDKSIAASKSAARRLLLQIQNAERFTLGDLVLPETISIHDQSSLIETESAVFIAWRDAIAERQAVFDEQLFSIEQRLQDDTEQLQIIEQQEAILRQQINKRLDAVNRGIITRQSFEALQQNLLQVQTRALQIRAQVNAKNSEAETIAKNINAQRATERAQFTDQLREERQRLSTLEARRGELENEIRLASPLAPIDGMVMGLVDKERNTAISGGETIARIVPEGAKPYVRVKIAATEVDNIRKATSVRVTFGFDEPVELEHIDARIARIDPDVQVDPQSGAQTYLVDLVFDPEQVEQGVFPGMPVEVGFVLDEGSMIWTLMKPFTDAYRKSFGA